MKLKITDQFKSSSFYKSLVHDHEIIMDNSEFTNWDGCYAKGILAGALKKQGTYGEVNLDFGSCVHEAMERKFLGGDVATQVKAAIYGNAAIDEEGELDINCTIGNEHYDKWLRLPQSEGIKNQTKVKELIAQYNVHYAMSDNYDVLHLDGQPMVEQSFRLPLGVVEIPLATKEMHSLFDPSGVNDFDPEASVSITIYWQGKIDLICRWRNQLWVLDHKTTSMMGAKFMDSFYRSSQMLGYFWACHQLVNYGHDKFEVMTEGGNLVELKDHKIQGVLVNALAVRKSGFEFQTFPMPIPMPNMTEWVTDTLQRFGYLIMQTAEYYSTENLVPTREHCTTKYGRCAFYDVCEAPAAMRLNILNSPAFKTSTWSPLK